MYIRYIYIYTYSWAQGAPWAGWDLGRVGPGPGGTRASGNFAPQKGKPQGGTIARPLEFNPLIQRVYINNYELL